ncbi:MAG: ferredoxin [Deltaproteobacteria bacterium]|nr:MAG: ferredoxin [Deltaproteobacteria bacterium]
MPAVVNRGTCNGCDGLERQECIFRCPYDAIAMTAGKAFVDKDKCDECRICIEVCPVRAIALE